MSDEPAGQILNAYGEPVPRIGGVTSRNLFREMWRPRVDRGGVPNLLWLGSSIALVVGGVLVMFL